MATAGAIERWPKMEHCEKEQVGMCISSAPIAPNLEVAVHMTAGCFHAREHLWTDPPGKDLQKGGTLLDRSFPGLDQPRSSPGPLIRSANLDGPPIQMSHLTMTVLKFSAAFLAI